MNIRYFEWWNNAIFWKYFLITSVIHKNYEIRYIQSNIMTALIEVQPFWFLFQTSNPINAI